MPAPPVPAPLPRLQLSAWRIVAWVIVLLAIFGIFEYCVHGWHVAAALRAASSGSPERARLTRMLVWDGAYLAGACITLAAAGGALLRRGWGRPALRVVAGLLALWMLASGILLARDLVALAHRSRLLLAQPGVADAGRELIAHVRRSYIVAIVLKGVGMLVLGWLAWRLGAPAVRAQFPVAPARRRG